ncbi:MAG TPA: hypothetical protein VK737_06725 [Opitutales bacterium]|jgi:hypothetical protein|nr:hypothetical protein [Opitutales bacterium]
MGPKTVIWNFLRGVICAPRCDILFWEKKIIAVIYIAAMGLAKNNVMEEFEYRRIGPGWLQYSLSKEHAEEGPNLHEINGAEIFLKDFCAICAASGCYRITYFPPV